MLIIINSVLPVFLIVALGSVLKHLRFTSDHFHKISDKLVYFIFFPVLLFWKIGNPVAADMLDWKLNLAVLLAVFVVYLLSLGFVLFTHVPHREVGSFSQACYRFNTYIGIAITLNVLGEEGVRYFGTMIGFTIPFINVLAVGTLIWFSSASYSSREKTGVIVKSMFSNPLIVACFLGILYSKLDTPLPIFLDNTFKLMAPVALPLALLSVGSSLDFARLKGHLRLATVSCLFRLIILPVVGYVFLQEFGVTGIPFTVGMIYFTIPTSTAIYILSSQFHSDQDLASAAILLSTLLSFGSLSTTLVLFGG
jgi:predicted permease